MSAIIDIDGAIRFLDHGLKLKSVPRQGWILKGIESPESVARLPISMIKN